MNRNARVFPLRQPSCCAVSAALTLFSVAERPVFNTAGVHTSITTGARECSESSWLLTQVCSWRRGGR